MVPNGMGNMSNHTHMHTYTCANTYTQPQVGPVQTNVSMSSWSDYGGRRRNTHSYLYFQCRILIDTGGVNKFAKWSMLFPCRAEGLGGRLVCVRVCVDIWERMVACSAEWIIL